MKPLNILVLLALLTGCNTTAGILSGAGKDLQAAGAWISPQQSITLK